MNIDFTVITQADDGALSREIVPALSGDDAVRIIGERGLVARGVHPCARPHLAKCAMFDELIAPCDCGKNSAGRQVGRQS